VRHQTVRRHCHQDENSSKVARIGHDAKASMLTELAKV
jgi:hypothetical protein